MCLCNIQIHRSILPHKSHIVFLEHKFYRCNTRLKNIENLWYMSVYEGRIYRYHMSNQSYKQGYRYLLALVHILCLDIFFLYRSQNLWYIISSIHISDFNIFLKVHNPDFLYIKVVEGNIYQRYIFDWKDMSKLFGRCY